jgi:hypothetical protein
MSKHFMAAVLASLGYLGASGCSVDIDGGAATDGDESVGRVSSAFSVETCNSYEAYDHFIGETWSHHAVLSDRVDLLDMNDPAYFIYNAYNYDYSEVCEDAFVTDIIARPSGNPAMTSRLTIQQGQVTGAMNEERCGDIHFQYALYAQKFNRDGVWHHLRNNFIHGTFANGRCTLPNVTFGKIDWKDGIPGIGKVGGLRYVVSAGENDTLYKTCLALDPDDQGDHLNSLCPNITL